MAIHEVVKKVTVLSGSDLSANQYAFVDRNASGELVLVGAGLAANGVLYEKPSAQGRPAAVAISGVAKVALGGTVVVGDDVAAAANGLCVAATTGDVILGVCVIGGANGEIGSVQLGIENRAVLA